MFPETNKHFWLQKRASGAKHKKVLLFLSINILHRKGKKEVILNIHDIEFDGQ